MNMNIEEGKTYILKHCRLGSALVKIIKQKPDYDFITIEVVEGELVGMTDEWIVGDVRDVRLKFCKFSEIKQ